MGEVEGGPAADAARARATRVLGSWWLLAALVVWGLNDHVGKDRWPGVVTGKVSDVAGLFALPLLVAALLTLALRPRSRRAADRIGLGAVVVVSVGFTLVKASAPIAAAVSSVWSFVLPTRLGADPTDLLTLAVTPLTYLVWIRVEAPRPAGAPTPGRERVPTLLRRIGRTAMIAVAVVLGAAVTTATSCADPHAIERVFLGDDGALYATGMNPNVGRSTDGGQTWTVEEVDVEPEWSEDQMVAPPLDEDEQIERQRAAWEAEEEERETSGGDASEHPPDLEPESYELCSTTTCWRSDLDESTITERDLDTGRTVDAQLTGNSTCTFARAGESMTLIRHEDRDVLIATNADRGIVRMTPGEEASYVAIDLPEPDFIGDLGGPIGIAAVVAIALCALALLGYVVWRELRDAITSGRSS